MTVHPAETAAGEPTDPEGIAVVGLAGRFPGAPTAERLWANLCAGTECFEDFTEQELLDAGVPREVLDDPDYQRRGPVLEGIEDFDAGFFGFSPATARGMDPQQRLLLECAWHALEDAGCDPSREERPVGVFAASSYNSYLLYNVLSRSDMRTFVGSGRSTDFITTLSVNDPNFFATRVSHALDLHGPSITVQTACSSSLVAVHLACQSLLAGECDVALAGGMTVRVPGRTGYQYDPGSIMSPDGRCRPFDADAGGTVFGSGGGLVVLKRLEDALADGDHIRAVVRGSAVNNDGALKMGYTAPSVGGQAAVVAEALAVAGVDPATIGYVEAHSTATALGDPIEVAALAQAFGPQRGKTCVLSSVKGAIGHLESASGVTGLITAVLALQNGVIPPVVNYRAPNPDLRLDATPFTVAAVPTPFGGAGPRRAGVSSLGVGGTNAHVVLEQAPPAVPEPPSGEPRVLLLSGRDRAALAGGRTALAGHLERNPGTGLDAAADTLARGRRAFGHRLAAVARSTAEAAERLAAPAHPLRHEGEALDGPPSVCLVYPGQGTQHPGMGAGLYRALPVFRSAVDRCAALFAPHLDGADLVAAMAGDAMLGRTDLIQAALFTVGHALTETLAAWGVTPEAVAGHSIGEYAAAHAAGILELPDAVRLVAARGRLMRDAPAGAMAGVRLPADRVTALLAGTGVEIAAVNDADSCVVAGPAAAVTALCERLTADGATARPLRTPHAFHTSAMDEAAERFAACFAGVRLNAPALPVLSNVTGTWMTDAEAADPARWAAQIRRPVRWAEAMTALLETPGRALVEAGPGRAMCGAAARSAAWGPAHRAVPVMRQAAEESDDHEVLLLALGRLWTAGADVDWSAVHPDGERRRVPLPGYRFQRSRHWIDSAYATRAADPRGHRPEPARRADAARAAAIAPPPGRDNEESAAPGSPAPSGTPAEEALAAVWCDLLGVAHVGPDDNFFDLGGDSITATQAAVRARRAGLEFAPKELFAHQTLRALAAVARSVTPAGPAAPAAPSAAAARPGPSAARQGPSAAGPRPAARPGRRAPAAPPLAAGPAGPTPEQLRLLQGRTGQERLPVALEVDPAIPVAALETALAAVLDHHEALRTTLTRTHGLWRQETAPAGALPPAVARLTAPADAGPAELAARCAAAAGPAPGPATATVVDRGADRPRLAVLLLDPALCDRASLRLLADDLADGCRRAAAGADARPAPVPVGWTQWAGHVGRLAADGTALEQADRWLETAHSGAGSLRGPAGTGPGEFTTGLDATATAALRVRLRDRGLTVPDLLAAALAVAAHRQSGTGRLLTEVAGSSRAAGRGGPDLTRTLGACGTRHPLLLDGGRGIEHALAQAADTRRSLTRQGLEYGILRHLVGPTAAALATAPPADVLVRHLGTAATAARRPLVAPAAAPPREAGDGHPLRVTTRVTDGCLSLRWTHDARLAADFTALLAERVTAALGPAPRAARAAPRTAPGRSGLSSISKSDLNVLLTSQSRTRS